MEKLVGRIAGLDDLLERLATLMHTGTRDRLHLTKLDAFAAWALTQGYQRERSKGDYEVLRLRKDGEMPLIFWMHYGGDHATTDARSERLVRQWFRER